MSALALLGATARLGQRDVLADVDLTVASGELVIVVGPNGAGKSSVIRALAGLLPLGSGEVRLGGVALSRLSSRERAARISYLPQDGRIAWNLPAVEIAALGAPFLSGPASVARAREALRELAIDHLADRGVAEMSGGERARVLVARALAAPAAALLADEPVAGLDPDAQLLVLDRLKARAGAGQAVLASLHDLDLAARYADRVIVLEQGAVRADAPPLEALTPEVLSSVFALDARWIEGPDGPLLSRRRYSPGSGSGVR
ncbi:ABC transporter ATP-binding protein [Brevundimonas sp. FT23028]|uniref:ABC transporter ATP-binding protein n=1 Tax=Brevundimonas sp. FT23028 TaxID=3393748 RepID=UPI003B58775A